MKNKSHLTINLLGTVSIKLNGKPVTGITSRTAIAILIYLIHQPHPILRDSLADFFWDGRSQKQAGANLRSALSRLRQKLPDYLIVTRETVAFNHALPHQVDALLLERELEKSLKAAQVDVVALEACLTHHHGDFLAGFYVSESQGFDNWATGQREKLHRLTAIALHKLTAYHLTNGSYLQGIPFGEQWVQIDPLDELAHQQLMWLLTRAGRRHEALQKYETCRQLLRNELALSPSRTTEELRQRIRNLTFPPPLHLPAFTSPFIGRQIELDQLRRQLLVADNPLVTILGMGGAGKSRLAGQVAKLIAAQTPGRFLDGIYFVPLVAVKNGSELITTLIELFDLSMSGQNSSAQLVAQLANHEMLLILDNFEQMAEDNEALDFLTQLISMHGKTRLLLTSRQRLFLQAEQIFPLGGLRYPQIALTDAIDYEAGVLFVDRTRRVRGNDLLNKEEVSAVLQICRAVEGSPIAIEMAAGSMWKMPATAIADQIENSITELAFVMRDVPARHRSVQAVFNYSWHLLAPNEQQTLAKLAVFPADFDVQAAAAITGNSAGELQVLTARSLLRQMDNGRFNLHPLVRQFAAEKLGQARGQVEEKHANYFAHFIQVQGDLFAAGKQEETLQTITHEIDNVRLMWQWITQHKQYATLRQVGDLLQQCFEIKGWFVEGRELFAAAVSHVEHETGKEAALTQAALLTHHGGMLLRISDYAAARHSLERALELQEKHGLYCNTSLTLGHLSNVTDLMGDSKISLQYIKSGLTVARKCGIIWQEAAFLNSLGVHHLKLGAYQTAATYMEKASIIQREIQSWQWLAMSLSNLGQCFIALGACDEAYGRIQAADEIAQRINYKIIQADIEINKGWVAFLQGDFDKAAGHVANSLALGREQKWNQHSKTAEANIILGMIAQNQMDFVTAREKFESSLRFFQKVNDLYGIVLAYAYLGQLVALLGELSTTRAYLRKAVEVAQESKVMPGLPQLFIGVAQGAIRENDWETAVQLLAIVRLHPISTEHERRQAQKIWQALATKLSSVMLTQAESEAVGVELSAFLPTVQQWLQAK